ncbi:hypothetical protein MKW92_020243 [Papaver armeniacum]|nr:hypothetical protein MKW92_020243 [Papaver armeniacum]
MASKPGILTEWPWKPLGGLKYLVLAPWVVDSIHSTFLKKCTNDDRGVDMTYIFILPLMMWRVIHSQIWVSLSRFRTSKSKSRIVDRPIEFEQVDRESNWDDQIILQTMLTYMVHKYVPSPGASYFPVWRTDGIVMTILLHTGPVEFLYYWLHRALHHHFLYSRYHSHHHSSIVTEPITSVIHPFGEHLMYFILFAIPLLTMVFTETVSMVAVFGYLTYIDFMNYMGHCNFEFVPFYLFTIFPFLKYIFYTPSYHSLHHTQFRTNYALFMPMYDYIYGTMDKSTDDLYMKSLRRQDESPHVVYLTHPVTPESIYHLRVGFATLASEPYNNKTYSKWSLIILKGLLWPLNWIFTFGSTFVIERNRLTEHAKVKLNMQTWVVPKCSSQYTSPKQRAGLNRLIEKAILDADKAGVKVLSLSLLNQGEELNRNGEVYIKRHPELKIKIVDGSNLAAIVVNNIINIIQAATSTNLKTQQVVVMIKGKMTKVACSIALALCQRGVQVVVKLPSTYDFEKLSLRLFSSNLSSKSPLLGGDHQNNSINNNLLLSTNYSSDDHGNSQVWLVGDGFSEEEHMRAPKETIFVAYSQFPPWFNCKKNRVAPKKTRKDCTYYSTPAMIIPPSLENVDSCETWLPRRVMSAWRVAGILHALEDWEGHECGNWLQEEDMMDKVWSASLRHGFHPFDLPVPAQQ